MGINRVVLFDKPDGSLETPFGVLVLKTLESILEVVLLAAGGFILARQKILTRESQKTISNLNMNLFTPALVASKLAGSLSRDQLGDLWLLPLAFVILTGVSYFVGYLAARVMHLPSKQTRFVMGCTIFQNSNSLPLALVSALAYSLDGLYWDQRSNDTDEAVASRGILYLLVFSQLGLSIRWSYGYNYLFARSRPGDRTETHSLAGEYDESFERYTDFPEHGTDAHEEQARIHTSTFPSTPPRSLKPASALDHGDQGLPDLQPQRDDEITTFPSLQPGTQTSFGQKLKSSLLAVGTTIVGFLNPPLYAMIIALIVACIPGLQAFFFTKGTFVYNSVTSATTTAGDCAVPLILVVLGGNLAQEKSESDEPLPYSTKTVWTAIVSRMLLVPLILLPPLALLARYAPISVVDDPIFLVVIFLLVGSPTAIQVASMCQLNEVFEEEIAKICWWSYAVLTVPQCLVAVVLALETVKLNARGPW